MIFEDAHWIDPTSVELLQLVVDRVQRLPALLVIIFRPEFTPPWSGYPHVTSLLARADSVTVRQRRLIERVTGGKALPPEVLTRSSRAPTACRCSSRS